MCLDAVSRSEERRLDALKEKRAQRKDGPPVSSNFQCGTCAGQGSGSLPTPGRIARDEIRRVDGSVQIQI